ncbi:glycosyl transferase family 90-domain-containing protein [Hyaloraphidium curvatum]|nr:glycosyl transferase family 90-domain-containing protein [Hyaloraphidium curvatum]
MAQPSNATDDEPPILDWMKEVYPPLIDPFAYALPDMDVPFNFYDEPRMFARLDDFLEGPPMSDDEAALLDTLANRTSDDVFRDLVSGLEPAWQDWTAEAKAMGCVDGVDDHGFFLGPTTLAFVDLTPRRVPMLNASTPEYWAAAEKLRGHKPFPFPHYPRDTPHRVLLPIFGGAKPRQCFADITLPSYAALTYGSYPWGWDAQPAWERKAERVYWRGTTTGGWIAGGRDWRRFHRQRLIKNWAGRRVSIPVPEGKAMWDGEGAPGSVYFDIFLTGVKQCDESPGSAREDPAAKDVLGDPEGWDEGFEPSVCDLAHRYYEGLLVKEYKRGTENLTVPEQEYWSKHWGVKYLIDLDGNAWSQRFQQFLWSNSLVLHAGVFREWFSGWFRAYEHWIPVRMDLSDLERTIRWASGTDEGRFEAKRVGERARELARRRLRYEDMQSYMFLLLLEYGSIGKEEYLWDL